MRKKLRLRLPSPAMIIALIALIVAMGGTGYAAIHLPKNSVGSKQLKKNAVINSKIKKNAVTGSKIKKNSVTSSKVKDHSLTGADINLGALGTVPSATNAANAANATHAGSADNANALQGHSPADFASSAFKTFRATATASGTSFASANTVVLYTDGPLSLVGHCWTNGTDTDAALAIRSSADAIYNSYSHTGDPSTDVVNAGTGDVDVSEDDAGGTSANLAGPYDGSWAAMTNDQSAYFTGLGSAGVLMNGSTPCIFTGFAVAS